MLIHIFVRTFFICLSSIYSAIKINNYEKISFAQKILLIVVTIIISILYGTLINYTPQIIVFIFSYYLLSILLSLTFKLQKLYSIILSLFSLAISFISLFISCALVYLLWYIPILNIILKDNMNILIFSIIGFIQLFLIVLFFKIKRFKDGFSFLKKENKNIDLLGILISITLIFVSAIVSIFTNRLYLSIMGYIIIIGGLIMFDWIRKKITEHYKKDLKEQFIENLTLQLNEKDKKIATMEDELASALRERHEFNHSFIALEYTLQDISNKIKKVDLNFDTEIAEEISVLVDSYQSFSSKYKPLSQKNSKGLHKLETTNISEIDSLLLYMQSEAEKYDIDFNVKLNDSIIYMINNLIPLDKFKIIIANHIENSIISIKHSSNSYKSILVMIGLIENYYELVILDSGMEFEIETLINLGIEPSTTHSDSGGTGTGFMLIFEILQNTGASLIITENNPQTNNYTKSITIRFDNKNEYVIYSYRYEEIKLKNMNNRIIINPV